MTTWPSKLRTMETRLPWPLKPRMSLRSPSMKSSWWTWIQSILESLTRHTLSRSRCLHTNSKESARISLRSEMQSRSVVQRTVSDLQPMEILEVELSSSTKLLLLINLMNQLQSGCPNRSVCPLQSSTWITLQRLLLWLLKSPCLWLLMFLWSSNTRLKMKTVLKLDIWDTIWLPRSRRTMSETAVHGLRSWRNFQCLVHLKLRSMFNFDSTIFHSWQTNKVFFC